MDILGIGVPELIFIFIIALMVLGPRRLPEYAAKAGKVVRDLRNMSQGFITEWRREIMVATRLDELEETRRELQEAKRLLEETHSDVKSETSQAAAETSQAVAETKKAVSGQEGTVPRSTAPSTSAKNEPDEPSPAEPPTEPSAPTPAPDDAPVAETDTETEERTIKPPPNPEPASVNNTPKVVNE